MRTKKELQRMRAWIKRQRRHAVSFSIECDVIDPASRQPFAVTISSVPEDGAFQGLLRVRAHSAAGRRFLSKFKPEQLLDFVFGGNAHRARVASKGKSSGRIWLHAIDVCRWIFIPIFVARGDKFAPKRSGRRRAPPRQLIRGK